MVNLTCSSRLPSCEEAIFRISCNVPDEPTRMVQHVCRNCLFDTTPALKDLGATLVVVGDERFEQRVLTVLDALAQGKPLPR